jgi:hypothetical protein
MLKTCASFVETTTKTCVDCKNFYTGLVCQKFLEWTNTMFFTSKTWVLLTSFYTLDFETFNLFSGGFYTKTSLTNNNNYLLNTIYYSSYRKAK